MGAQNHTKNYKKEMTADMGKIAQMPINVSPLRLRSNILFIASNPIIGLKAGLAGETCLCIRHLSTDAVDAFGLTPLTLLL